MTILTRRDLAHAGLPCLATWRANPQHPVGTPQLSFPMRVDSGYMGTDRVDIRVGDGASPTYCGAKLVRILEPSEWTPEILYSAERAVEAEYGLVAEAACNPIGHGQEPSGEELLRRCRRARGLKSRAWRFGVLARQLRDRIEPMQHHIDYLFAGADLAAGEEVAP